MAVGQPSGGCWHYCWLPAVWLPVGSLFVFVVLGFWTCMACISLESKKLKSFSENVDALTADIASFVPSSTVLILTHFVVDFQVAFVTLVTVV